MMCSVELCKSNTRDEAGFEHWTCFVSILHTLMYLQSLGVAPCDLRVTYSKPNVVPQRRFSASRMSTVRFYIGLQWAPGRTSTSHWPGAYKEMHHWAVSRATGRLDAKQSLLFLPSPTALPGREIVDRSQAPDCARSTWSSLALLATYVHPPEAHRDFAPDRFPATSVLYIFTSIDGDHRPRACFKADAMSFASCFILAPASRPLMSASGDLPSFFEEAPYRTPAGFKSMGTSRCSSRAS
ncbi:hypothetical protein BDY17DRAFT_85385 [Neohortaea acidophila]|uniref:Uncharacterized protein n=1 Tax=Neohortaea acidophila TaxID=245834 RepID=A0A6A6Q2Y1_9PEZI|nr:uncharacterized protein BDY17DRAFT_85385 [Neohortaea acidophila]KAF2486760.1 hypothetical protein BDY17DRAFT_85385 [Neohortaea acidophila]